MATIDPRVVDTLQDEDETPVDISDADVKILKKGGALYAYNLRNLTILKTNFIENEAEISGGSIYAIVRGKSAHCKLSTALSKTSP